MVEAQKGKRRKGIAHLHQRPLVHYVSHRPDPPGVGGRGRSPLMTTGKKGSLLLCIIPDNGSKVTKPCNLFLQFGIGTPVSKHMRHYQIIAYGGVCSPTILGDVFSTGISN